MSPYPPKTAADVLANLMDGNQRFAAGKFLPPGRNAERRASLASAQHPLAAILACSDSRVSPEIIFDQGLGDIYTVRLAGHVVNEFVLGSLEHAVEHLGVQLVLVLGHEGCGAVRLTVDAVTKSDIVVGQTAKLVEVLRPLVKEIRLQGGDLLDNAIRANVKEAVRQIKSSWPFLLEAVQLGRLTVAGAYYRLSDGKVTILT